MLTFEISLSYHVPFKSHGDFQLKVMVIFTSWFAGGDMFQSSYAIMLYEDVDF